MPIVASAKLEHIDFYERLSEAGVRTISPSDAMDQVIRPARIALLNLMPATAMERTEIQWLRYISQTLLQVQVVPIKFDKDERELEGGKRAEKLARYTGFTEAIRKPFDALIVTGDNRELDTEATDRRHLPFDKIRYIPQLRDVMSWADEHVALGVYSCLGAHIALNELHGIDRRPLGAKKVHGVYPHDILDSDNAFTKDMNRVIWAPHSRHGDIPTDELTKTTDVEVLAANKDIGWLLATSTNAMTGRQRLFLQGHPEYDDGDLNDEWLRDSAINPNAPVPDNYYLPDGTINRNWRTDTRALHANIVDRIYSSFASAT